jgi:uridine phosphorylase
LSEIPILDFDPDPRGIIHPPERFKPGTVPEHVVITFFSQAHAALVAKEGPATLVHLKSCGLDYPVHEIKRRGKSVGLFLSYIGAAGAGAFLEELIASGGRKFIVCGGAGVLDPAIAQGHLLLPTSAVRDEGLSYHYLPPEAEAKPSPRALAALKAELEARKAPYREGKTWTTDGVYRETRGKIAKRKAEGCLSVEMEAAGFFSVAQFRGVELAQLLYGGDDVSGEEWDHRGWDQNLSVQGMMLELCLEAVLGL